MKKLFSMFLMFIICILLFTNLYARSGDMFSTGPNEEFRIDSAGSPICPGANMDYVDVSSYTQPIICHEHWTNLPAASSFSVYTVLVASGLSYCADKTLGTDVLARFSMGARNVRCSIQFDGDDLLPVVSSFAVHGISAKGESISEIIQVSTISAIDAATNVTSNAFLYVSSITYRIVSSGAFTTKAAGTTNVRLNVGFGVLVGLCNDIITSTDLIAVAEDAGVIVNRGSSQGGINTTYDTIDFLTDPDGTNNYDAYYKIRNAP